ncbi:hypothetical protein OROMI_021891 [Orobanche minor]
MASSQTTSFIEKKESIIDGCLFVLVMEPVKTENDDVATMEHVVSRIKQTGLFNVGIQHSELYDESLVEEFYREASVCFRSIKKGGYAAEISAKICGVEIRINCHLLEYLFSLPSSGLKMEELESFGSNDLMSTFWCVFIGDITDKKVHPSCHKKRVILPLVYLHDFCCRVVENRTGAIEMCTNLRFRMMLAIMFGEPVNLGQIILKRLQEEVSKPLSQKKSFGLLLNNIFSCLDVPFSKSAKKIGTRTLIGGCKPTAYNKDIISADRPSVFDLPHSVNPRDVTEKSKSVSSNKRKHSISDKKSSPAIPEKKKTHKPKPTEVAATPAEAQTQKNAEVAQPTAHNLQGATPAEEVVAAIYADLGPMAAMTDDQLLAKVEGTCESTAFLESVAASPVRVSTPVQDPSPHRVPSPARDPSPIRATIPDWEEEEKFILEITDTTNISLLIRWENSFCHELIMNFYIAQAEALLKGKTIFVDHASSSPSDDLDDDYDAFQAGMRMSREEAQESELRSTQSSQGQGTSKDRSSPQPQQEAAEERIQEESVLLVQPEEVQDAEIATAPQDKDTQQPAAEPSIDAPASPSSHHMVEFIPEDRQMHPTHHAALLMLTGPEELVARPESPRSTLRKEHLEALGRHNVFIQDVVSALHNVGKSLDKLNVSAAEEVGSVKSDLSNLVDALQVLPHILKVALANIQQQRREILEKEQAKYSTFATRTAIALKESGTMLTGYDKNLDDLSLTLQSMANKFSKIKGKQDDVMDLVHSINSHVSVINARKGEEESREAACRWRLQKEAEMTYCYINIHV